MDIDKIIDTAKNEVAEVPKAENIPTLSDTNVGNQIDTLNQQYIKKQVENGETLKSITEDIVHAHTTSELFKDDSKENLAFQKELKQEKKEELKESFKKEKIAKQTLTLSEKQKKAEAFYKSFRPILEFDFANLIGSKNSTAEKELKVYEDRAYGIPLMVLMLILYTPLFCTISLILALFNGVNAIFSSISCFGKIAKGLCYSIFIIIVLTLVVYVGIIGIEQLFNVEIISKIKL